MWHLSNLLCPSSSKILLYSVRTIEFPGCHHKSICMEFIKPPIPRFLPLTNNCW